MRSFEPADRVLTMIRKQMNSPLSEVAIGVMTTDRGLGRLPGRRTASDSGALFQAPVSRLARM
jgi:hypothetical protein